MNSSKIDKSKSALYEKLAKELAQVIRQGNVGFLKRSNVTLCDVEQQIRGKTIHVFLVEQCQKVSRWLVSSDIRSRSGSGGSRGGRSIRASAV